MTFLKTRQEGSNQLKTSIDLLYLKSHALDDYYPKFLTSLCYQYQNNYLCLDCDLAND